MWSAPTWRAAAAFSGDETVVRMVAPFHFANWMTYWLTAPAPPETNTIVPLPIPARATACAAVIAGMPRQAPASKLTFSGNGTACAAGNAINSAAVPNGRFHWPFQTHTRSPMRDRDTPAPTSSITPAPSLWGTTCGKAILRVEPCRDFTSDGFTPDVASLT